MIEREIGRLRLQRALIQPADIEQRRQQFFGHVQAVVDPTHQRRRFIIKPIAILFERGCKQARRVQRLQQIVTGRGQKTALAAIGLFGLGFGRLQRLNRGLQLKGAVLHLLFHGRVSALEFRLGLLVAGHIAIGRDIAFLRHRIAAHFQHAPVAVPALEHIRQTAAHMMHALTDALFDISIATQATLEVIADQFLDRTTDINHIRRIFEQIDIGLIPADQPQIGIDHTHALADVVKRRFEQITIKLNGA